MDLYECPPCKHCYRGGAKTFGLGGQYSGVSFHYHGPGFSEVLIGRKLWLLYPPAIRQPPGHHPNISVETWMRSFYEESKIVRPEDSGHNRMTPNITTRTATDIFGKEVIIDNALGIEDREYHLQHCILEPGELLYFPSEWMHATLNLDDYNVFVSLFLDAQLMKD